MPNPPETPKRPKLKPPPNYTSKSAQAKLFLLVVACMGVLYLVTEAAKPESWARFFGEPVAAPRVNGTQPASPGPPEQARGSLIVARFYEKKRQWDGALVYYNEVLIRDPQSKYADEAKQRIQGLGFDKKSIHQELYG